MKNLIVHHLQVFQCGSLWQIIQFDRKESIAAIVKSIKMKSVMRYIILKSKVFSAKSHSENAGNRSCGILHFKFFRGCSPNPPRIVYAFAPILLPPSKKIKTITLFATTMTPLLIIYPKLSYE